MPASDWSKTFIWAVLIVVAVACVVVWRVKTASVKVVRPADPASRVILSAFLHEDRAIEVINRAGVHEARFEPGTPMFERIVTACAIPVDPMERAPSRFDRHKCPYMSFCQDGQERFRVFVERMYETPVWIPTESDRFEAYCYTLDKTTRESGLWDTLRRLVLRPDLAGTSSSQPSPSE